MTKGTTNAIPYKKSYGFAGVRIQIDEQNPDTRCTYPEFFTVNNKQVKNSAYGRDPAYNSEGENQLGNTGHDQFDMGGWSKHLLVKGIKPVSFDGSTWTDLDKTQESSWPTAQGTDCFTEFPFNWLSITNDGTYINIIFSDNDTQPDSTFQCYAHAKGCDSYSSQNITSALASASREQIMASNSNNYFANAFHIGCFQASGGLAGQQIYSRRNLTPAHVQYAYYWQGANQRGTDYDCMSFQQITYIQALFVLLYKSTDSQVRHSRGLVDASQVDDFNSGLSTTSFGMAGQATSQVNSFFWINNIWGNMYQRLGGLWNRSGSTYTSYYWLPRQANSRAFNNGWTQQTTQATQQSLGTSTGQTGSRTQSYIYKVAGTNIAGFLPTSQTGGGSSTYYPDQGNVNVVSSSAYFPALGGSYSSGNIAGIFCCYVNYSSTDSASNYGSRLSYRGGHW